MGLSGQSRAPKVDSAVADSAVAESDSAIHRKPTAQQDVCIWPGSGVGVSGCWAGVGVRAFGRKVFSFGSGSGLALVVVGLLRRDWGVVVGPGLGLASVGCWV